jgi:hypothetical protein
VSLRDQCGGGDVVVRNASVPVVVCWGGLPCRDGALSSVVCASLLRGDELVMPRVVLLVRVGPYAGF